MLCGDIRIEIIIVPCCYFPLTLFSKILKVIYLFNRKIHVRFHSTWTGTHTEVWTSRRRDSVSDPHWYFSSRQHSLVIWSTRYRVAKRRFTGILAFDEVTACRKGERSYDGCKAELLLVHQFRGMRERAFEARWWGWRNQKDGPQADEDFSWSLLEQTREPSTELLHDQSKACIRMQLSYSCVYLMSVEFQILILDSCLSFVFHFPFHEMLQCTILANFELTFTFAIICYHSSVCRL